MARTATLRNTKAIASALKNLEQTSRYLNEQLVNLGYVEVQKFHTGTVGRPAHQYVLTGKGRGLVAISKNWGNKASAEA